MIHAEEDVVKHYFWDCLSTGGTTIVVAMLHTEIVNGNSVFMAWCQQDSS